MLTAMQDEKLLQFIWQRQLFHKTSLYTQDGELVKVVSPGIFNTNQGPDFLDARIFIDDVLFAGHVEIHISDKDWFRHGHETDPHYQNVILHVVWQFENAPLPQFAVLELQHIVSHLLVEQYRQWMLLDNTLPCASNLSQVNTLVWMNWLERLSVARLERKTKPILVRLVEVNYHWNQLLWECCAKLFGGKINGDLFESVAQQLSYEKLIRVDDLFSIESILLGQMNLLQTEEVDAVPFQKEYHFWKQKWQLESNAMTASFLRMMPAGFPTIRAAQLAAFIHQLSTFFSFLVSKPSLELMDEKLNFKIHSYWNQHYQFGKKSDSSHSQFLSKDFKQLLVINVFAPILFLYGKYKEDESYVEVVLDWLQALPSERNKWITFWKQVGVRSSNALDSQALLELKTQYCDQKRCLSCAIGCAILDQ